MKIVEQTPTRMVLQQSPGGMVGFMLLWGSLFSGIPLLAMLAMIYNAGVTDLSCQRIEPTQVTCESQQSRLFGLLPGQPTPVRQVMSAQITSETRSSDDGDYDVYRPRLVSPAGYFDIGDFSTDRSTTEQWVTQTNQFLRSSQPELNLSHDNRWSPATLFSILFMSPFVIVGSLVMNSTIQSRTLILDKNLNRIIYEVWRFSGKRRREYPLGIVKRMEIKEHTDSYGNVYFDPVLLPDQVRSITFARTSNRQDAVTLQEQIHEFLKLPI